MPLSAAEPEGDAGEPASILLVDDRPENLLALEEVLRPLGQHLVRATSGEEALKRVLTDDFAVILLDVQMPGLDGFETAAHIKQRERSRHIPIIFLTAISREPAHVVQGYAAGAVDFLTKPFEPWLLRSKVAVFLDLHRKNVLLERQAHLLRETLAQRTQAQQALVRKALELRASNEELQRSNRDLAQFASIVSHDLGQPLLTISGFLQLLRRLLGDKLDAAGAHALDGALQGAERMRMITDDLLAYSRVGTAPPTREPVDLAALVGQTRDNLGFAIAESGAEVVAEELPTVMGQRSLLAQLLQNLVANALKFVPPGVAPVVRLTCEDQGTAWCVSVRDNGIGVPDDDRERIFEMFQRLPEREAYPGTGIGLAICKRVVELHGGRIWVEPAPGGGSAFRFTIARPEGGPEPVPAQP